MEFLRSSGAGGQVRTLPPQKTASLSNADQPPLLHLDRE
jgi:hypothetical protein